MKTFITEKAGFAGPNIEALDFAHAELLVQDTDLTVIGEHRLTISRKGFTPEDADKMCKAFAEQEYPE